jgi:putative dimethyl sulfoxide reductase chaperone
VRRPDQDEASVAQTHAAGPPQAGPAATFADVCAGRAAIYEVLTYGLSEPSAAFVQALAGGEIVMLLRDAVGWLRAGALVYEPAIAALAEAGSKLTAIGVALALRDLRVEYARLFTGPGRPAVMGYASEYLDAEEGVPGRLNTGAAATAEAAYKAEGVSPVAAGRDLPDAATTELEFLYHLCRREEAAWTAGDDVEAARLRRSLGAFLRQHAGLWMPRFATSVCALAEQGVYVALAELLTAHLAAELGLTASDGPTGLGK